MTTNCLLYTIIYFWKSAIRNLNLMEIDHWGDPGVDARIILKRIFRKWDVGVWTGLSWRRTYTDGGDL
jgi:hypothetical protein